MDELKEEKIKKKKIEKKILKNKNSEGRLTYRLTIPKEWIDDMVDNDEGCLMVCEDNSLILEYFESAKTISVKRKEKTDEKEKK